MNFQEIYIPVEQALEIGQFKEMDYYTVNNYDLPVELMMENAGLQLANLVAHSSNKTKKKAISILLKIAYEYKSNLEPVGL